MSLPDYTTWTATRRALHQSMQVLRSARLLGSEPLPNDLHYSTLPTPQGATTGPLRNGGEVILDYRRLAIAIRRGDEEVATIPLAGHSQTSLFDAAFDALAAAGLEGDPARGKVTETEPFAVDAEQGAAFAEVQWRMFRALARAKARFLGPQTPIALWPHGFDLSTLWFVRGMDERRDPQINFGFSPGTPDVGQPYVYVTAWPAPDGLAERLPAGMEWHTAWSTPGGLLRYETFANGDDPETVVAEALIDAYRAASELLNATPHA